MRWDVLELPQPQCQCVKCPCFISLHLMSPYNGESQSNYEETLCRRDKSVMLEFDMMKQCMLICVCVGCWVLFRKKEELSLDIEPYCDANWCAVWPFRIVCQQSTCLWPLRFTPQQDSSWSRQYWVLLLRPAKSDLTSDIRKCCKVGRECQMWILYEIIL